MGKYRGPEEGGTGVPGTAKRPMAGVTERGKEERLRIVRGKA